MNQNLLYTAALILSGIGAAHSILGERFILVRLFQRDNLPKLFGDQTFTVQTIRFAWHLTTVLMLGLAGVMVALGAGLQPATVGMIAGCTTIACGLFPLIATRGRHLAWIAFFASGLLCLYWAFSSYSA